MKNPLTPAGIEPATFRFVVQCLNHRAAVVPCFYKVPIVIREAFSELILIKLNGKLISMFVVINMVYMTKQSIEFVCHPLFNPLKPNNPYRRRTTPLTSKIYFYIFIQQI